MQILQMCLPDVTAGTCAAGLRGEPGSLSPCRVPQGTVRQDPNKLDAQSSTQPLGARLAQQPGQVSAALQGSRRPQIPFSGWELGKKGRWIQNKERGEGRAGGCGSADPYLCLAEDELFSGDNTVDLLIEDQLLRPSGRVGEAVRKPSPVGWPPTPSIDPSTAPTTLPLSTAASVGPTPEPTTASLPPPTVETATTPSVLPEEETPQLLTASASVVAPVATESPPVANSSVPSPAVATTSQTSWDAGMSPEPGMGSSPGPSEQASTPPPLSTTIPATPKQALEEEDIRNIIGECTRMAAGPVPSCWLVPVLWIWP